ncbi:MAG: hypothetical protein WCS21_08485 [Lachnospiraceae bacterium]
MIWKNNESMKKSIITNNSGCYICGSMPTEVHHIMFGKNRKLADQDGLTVPLCPEHHRGTFGVHGKYGHRLDEFLKRTAERAWMKETGKNVKDWIERYGKNYL